MDWRREVNGKREISFEGFWSKATREGWKEGRSAQRQHNSQVSFSLPVSALIEPRLEGKGNLPRAKGFGGKGKDISCGRREGMLSFLHDTKPIMPNLWNRFPLSQNTAEILQRTMQTQSGAPCSRGEAEGVSGR